MNKSYRSLDVILVETFVIARMVEAHVSGKRNPIKSVRTLISIAQFLKSRK